LKKKKAEMQGGKLGFHSNPEGSPALGDERKNSEERPKYLKQERGI